MIGASLPVVHRQRAQCETMAHGYQAWLLRRLGGHVPWRDLRWQRQEDDHWSWAVGATEAYEQW